MFLMRIARGESVGIVFGTPVHHKIHHAFSVCITIFDGTGEIYLQSTCHLLLSCLLYQLEFPTLFLAMREIIANAFLSVRISPRTVCKDTIKF